ncbi:hypothetical protein [Williamsia sp. CHRR-6]|uniref:hypothetical protein n=1 Tax=Williamsia sp. CHRR-6 TaxID=2835871 RepID=UPI001BDA3A8B|nr:hypothetical protein [Williamsia sp. CHRR-6]MBT0568552.1 hypothetical protein [Williamsia sp. CHRR-6]
MPITSPTSGAIIATTRQTRTEVEWGFSEGRLADMITLPFRRGIVDPDTGDRLDYQ